ncbi:hypothetical protein LSH36_277g03042 [Paralvinella palmiformis]|uniref:Dienelactone hydrolase domain-containing protein n=1 Tax=Paralvinella palmiformis TaxID=53620 RepID=A0AAD9N1V7_9ANNE|nr:hypothetical protein LSH36_277g03042 [Paralvinella palmiformis]
MAEQGSYVTFPSANKAGPGCGMLFGDPKICPLGLIVIHEWWGMNDQIKTEGAMMAKDGNFTVLVPDYYRGKVADDREEAGHLMAGLDWSGALLDTSAAAEFLKQKGCSEVGVTGFCLGGALSFAAAVKCPQIKASVPFYGIPSPEVADLSKIQIPIQAHFAEKDEFVGFSAPVDYEPLREKLVAAGVKLEFYTYNVSHAFTNHAGPNYDAEATKLSFSRVYAFMKKNLKNE